MRIKVGDIVMVTRLAFEGKYKLEDRFEEEIYRVIEQPRPEIPVFMIRGTTSGQEKVLHRNHLHLLDNQDERSDDADEPEDRPI